MDGANINAVIRQVDNSKLRVLQTSGSYYLDVCEELVVTTPDRFGIVVVLPPTSSFPLHHCITIYNLGGEGTTLLLDRHASDGTPCEFIDLPNITLAAHLDFVKLQNNGLHWGIIDEHIYPEQAPN